MRPKSASLIEYIFPRRKRQFSLSATTILYARHNLLQNIHYFLRITIQRMKTSTLVSFVTLGIVSTNALASVLPSAPSRELGDMWISSLYSRRCNAPTDDDPTSLLSPLQKDNPEPVLLSNEDLTHKLPSTGRRRFRKQGFSHGNTVSFPTSYNLLTKIYQRRGRPPDPRPRFHILSLTEEGQISPQTIPICILHQVRRSPNHCLP